VVRWHRPRASGTSIVRASAGGSRQSENPWVSKPCSSVNARVTRDGNPPPANRAFQKGISAGDRLIPAPRDHPPLWPQPELRGERAHMGLYDSLATSMGGPRFDHLDQRGRRDGLESDTCSPSTANVVILRSKDYLKSRDRSGHSLPPERTAGLHLPYFRFDFLCAVMESSRRCKAEICSETLIKYGPRRGFPNERFRRLAAWIELSLVSGLGGQRSGPCFPPSVFPTEVLKARDRSSVARAEALAGHPRAKQRLRSGKSSPDGLHSPGIGADPRRPDYPSNCWKSPIRPRCSMVAPTRSSFPPGAAVVGSRNAPPQGLNMRKSFARAFSEAGLVIVSGWLSGVTARAPRRTGGARSTIAVWPASTSCTRVATSRSRGNPVCRRARVEFPLGTAPTGKFPGATASSRVLPGCLVGEAASIPARYHRAPRGNRP